MANDAIFETLNNAQRQAVAALDGPVLILAGAGTGKTHTVTCRIAHMIEKKIQASEILAVTFTNKAASEMKERIAQTISKKAADAMTVCTFHSLCVQILRHSIELLGFKKNFTICSYSDQLGIMKQLIVRRGGSTEKVKAEAVLSVLSKAKNSSVPLADIQDDFFSLLAIEYQNELRAQNAVDFDDLLVLAEKILSDYPEARSHFQNRFKRITVDEFQDTNALQMSLLQQIVAHPFHICVVGDDDQSIYAWRGAEVANILQFEKFFPNPTTIRLEENYRSTESILHTANSLIVHNRGRHDKILRSTRGEGESIRVIAMPGDLEEAEFIAEEILAEKSSLRREWEDFAVLFRTNGQSRNLEIAFRENKIPYRMIGAQSFYDRREVRDILAYLHVFASPDADIPLLRILNAPSRGIGQNTAVLAIDWSREHGQSLWQALCDPSFTDQLSQKIKNAVQAFVALVAHAKNRIDIKHENPADVLKETLKEIEYLSWIHRSCKTDQEKQQRSAGIQDVIESLEYHVSKGHSLQLFLDQSALSSEKEDEDIEKKSGATLITLHASKGLEFPFVYLIGLEQGFLPHKRSVDEGNCDEERRLFYVGITRAQEMLTLSYCSTRMKWGERHHCQPSSFLAELSPTYIKHQTYGEIMSTEAQEDEIDHFFGNLKGMLDGL